MTKITRKKVKKSTFKADVSSRCTWGGVRKLHEENRGRTFLILNVYTKNCRLYNAATKQMSFQSKLERFLLIAPE
jgi:hypothetical protein